MRKSQQIRSIPDIALKVNNNLLRSVKQNQVLLVNTAASNEKSRPVQLRVVINDPFNGYFTCSNEKNITRLFEYECVLEIITPSKRKNVFNFI
jgi:hypothetical protein